MKFRKKVGITTVYVTHDQEEALAISDRIAIMNEGVIQQIATPKQLYTRPNNIFVSTFIGHSNLFGGTYHRDPSGAFVTFKNGFQIAIPEMVQDYQDHEEVIISVRPEEFMLSEEGIEVTIKNRTFLGKFTNYELDFEKGMVIENQTFYRIFARLGTVSQNL